MDFHYTGWKRRIAAAVLGLCATLALPPLYIFPLLIPSFSGLFLLIRNAAGRRQAFWDGWWWGLGYFTSGLYWICISLYVEPEKFAWLTPFALFGLPSILGIYTGLFGLVASCLLQVARNRIPSRLQPATCNLLIFSALFVTIEYVRSYLFTGFPWNLIGYVFTASDISLQSAFLFGIYGLGFITVFISAVPALFLLKENAKLAGALSIFICAFILLFGSWRLENTPTQYSHVKIRIVQANIPQVEKMDERMRLEMLRKYLLLTHLPGIESINLVIWPEAAVPYYIDANSPLLSELGTVLPDDALLITGGLRADSSAKGWQAWNSLFVINHNGKLITQYDKHHIVPFGEFIPFRNILPVENIAGGHGDFSRGSGAKTIEVDNVPPFSPLICYEAIFPDEATDKTDKSKWLLNVTNDAWFGTSSGPYQHLQMARMRAVENNMPLVRAANTGISTVIDPVGRIIEFMPLNTEGVIDFYLPLPKP